MNFQVEGTRLKTLEQLWPDHPAGRRPSSLASSPPSPSSMSHLVGHRVEIWIAVLRSGGGLVLDARLERVNVRSHKPEPISLKIANLRDLGVPEHEYVRDATRRERLARVFAAYDADHSCSIDCAEFEVLVADLCELRDGERPYEDVLAERAAAVMARADKDGDSLITISEFVDAALGGEFGDLADTLFGRTDELLELATLEREPGGDDDGGGAAAGDAPFRSYEWQAGRAHVARASRRDGPGGTKRRAHPDPAQPVPARARAATARTAAAARPERPTERAGRSPPRRTAIEIASAEHRGRWSRRRHRPPAIRRGRSPRPSPGERDGDHRPPLRAPLDHARCAVGGRRCRAVTRACASSQERQRRRRRTSSPRPSPLAVPAPGGASSAGVRRGRPRVPRARRRPSRVSLRAST